VARLHYRRLSIFSEQMGDTDIFDYKGAIRDIEKTIAALQPPRKVLLVDDDVADVTLILKKLESFNVEVTVVHTGEEAQVIMAKVKFDLVMFDLVMPGMDGLELIMRTTGLNPGTRFALITGYPSSHKVDAVLKQGAVMLAKPLDDHALEVIVPRKIKAV